MILLVVCASLIIAPSCLAQDGTPDIIQGFDYPAQTHYVTTEDGYILQAHRIPAQGAQPVLHLHGYESSSAEIILRGPGKSLGFLMADRGYDVWMINFRGNLYSRNHTVLNPDDKSSPFWNFTWWEMGESDIPPVIDYILTTTGAQQVQIVGHSQGMSALYVMLSQHPQYADKISLISGMAPISYNSNTKGMLRWCAPFLTSLSDNRTQSEFLHPSELIHLLTDMFCNENSTFQETCYDFLFLVTGFDMAQQDRALLPTQLRHFPSGTGARVIVHTAQLILSAKFQAFDWGIEENIAKYGSSDPTAVDLAKVTPPHALYVAQGNDYLSQPPDYGQLVEELPNVVKMFTVDFPSWNHMDFLTGIDAPRLLYPEMLDEMDKYKYINIP